MSHRCLRSCTITGPENLGSSASHQPSPALRPFPPTDRTQQQLSSSAAAQLASWPLPHSALSLYPAAAAAAAAAAVWQNYSSNSTRAAADFTLGHQHQQLAAGTAMPSWLSPPLHQQQQQLAAAAAAATSRLMSLHMEMAAASHGISSPSVSRLEQPLYGTYSEYVDYPRSCLPSTCFGGVTFSLLPLPFPIFDLVLVQLI